MVESTLFFIDIKQLFLSKKAQTQLKKIGKRIQLG
jgi:hypothetical protein